MKPRAPTDSRKLRDEMNRRLLGLVILMLVVVGGGLIAFIYGPYAAITGVLCLLAGSGVIGFLWLLFTFIGKWVDRN